MFVIAIVILNFLSSGACLNININARIKHNDYLKNHQIPAKQKELWITMDSDAAKFVSKSSISSRISSSDDGTPVLLKVDEQNLPLISRIFQGKRQFGEYMVHQSLEEANRYRSRTKFGDQSVFIPPKINNRRVVLALQKFVQSKRILQFVHILTRSFKNRDYKSSYGIKASQFIKEVWTQIALPRKDIKVNFYEHSGFPQKSVIVTISGSEKFSKGNNTKSGIVIIGAHLDSINQKVTDQSTARAPGADDNGSGLSVLTEVLRVIVESDYRPEKTIQLMAFAGEEKGKLGSGEISSAYRKQGTEVEAMLNFDMIGYKGRGKDIYISIDKTNKDLAIFLSNLISIYLPNVTYESMIYCGGCSDHASWFRDDFPAVMATSAIAPDDEDTFNPNYHTAEDLKVDEKHMKNFALLTVAFLAELAKGYNVLEEN